MRISLIPLASVVVLVVTSPIQAATPAVADSVPFKASPFNLKQVRLLDGPFRQAMERDRRYLHDLEPDRLLHSFRLNAGLPSSTKPLGGWEKPDCELRGHFLGHYLSACALMYASTGDEKLKAKADAIVAELAKCQDALGPGGYLSAYPESFFDRLEAGKPVWAPWYTLHKILAGLLDMHVHCGNQQALAVLKKKAQWIKTRTGRLTDEHMARTLQNEFGGMNEVLLNLYAVTGDPAHLALARRFDHERFFRPLAEKRDELKGLHADTNIPKITGAARAYELTGQKPYRDIAEFFWHQVAEHRSYSTGGNSNHEHWRTEPDKLAGELSLATQECCCTYNMLKLTRHLFAWTADPKAADFYERALLNSILGTQDPETGMMMYFVPLASGYWKLYNTPRDSFWCCTGTGVESFAKLGDSIYFHDKDSLLVNLFIASELNWPEKGLRIRQETRFPEQEGTALAIQADNPIELAIRLRIPYWAAQAATATVNGKPVEGSPRPGSYLTIRRTWAAGDRIELSLPMRLHACPMPDDKTVTTIMYGPLVLAGELGSKGLTRETTFSLRQAHHPGGPVPAPYFLTESNDLSAWIKPVAGKPLTFATEGQDRNITLVPLCRLFGQRYAVYWNVFRRGSPEHQRRLALEEVRKQRAAQTIDRCEIGDPASEEAHGLAGQRTSAGPFGGRQWRHASGGGWFSYRVKVLPDRPMVLFCTYWGDDRPPRKFDILIDDQKIATQELNRAKPGEFFDVEYPVPAELTRGKQQVTVKFQAHPGNTAGGVFGVEMLK